MMVKGSRQKKCILCDREFVDGSWAATAKYCGNKCQQKANSMKHAARRKAAKGERPGATDRDWP